MCSPVASMTGRLSSIQHDLALGHEFCIDLQLVDEFTQMSTADPEVIGVCVYVHARACACVYVHARTL